MNVGVKVAWRNRNLSVTIICGPVGRGWSGPAILCASTNPGPEHS